MDYLNFFSQRLNELRTQKGVSARDMSLSLGQCESYINKIENQKSLPSMNVFFYICDFLKELIGEDNQRISITLDIEDFVGVQKYLNETNTQYKVSGGF